MTVEQIRALVMLADAGVRALGIKVWESGAGEHVGPALAKLQEMAAAAEAKESDNG